MNFVVMFFLFFFVGLAWRPMVILHNKRLGQLENIKTNKNVNEKSFSIEMLYISLAVKMNSVFNGFFLTFLLIKWLTKVDEWENKKRKFLHLELLPGVTGFLVSQDKNLFVLVA